MRKWGLFWRSYDMLRALLSFLILLFLQKRLSSEKCAQLTIIAATHNLKEVWISYQVSILNDSLIYPVFILD